MYGESQPQPERRTIADQAASKSSIGAGVVTSEAYDFKGNLLRSKRDLFHRTTKRVDWQQNPAPNAGTFITSSTPTTRSTARSPLPRRTTASIARRYNEANLLDEST